MQSWKLWNRKVKQSPDKEQPNFKVTKLRTERAGQSKCSAQCYICTVLYKCHTEHKHLNNLKTTRSLWSTFWVFFFPGHVVLACLRLYFLLSFCSGQHAGCWKLIYWQRFRFFHYAAHMLPGRAHWKQPSLAHISSKNTPLSSFHSAAKKLLLAADCNDLYCPLLEPDDRGHVHFHHAAYCISVMSISRWVADLLS